MLAKDALALRAGLVAQLREVALQAPNEAALFTRTVGDLEAATDATGVKLLAARALRELMQRASALQAEAAPEPVDRRAERNERKRLRAARTQSRALAEHRSAPARPAEQPVETLGGIGPSLGQHLRARGLHTLSDLMWLLPLAYDDQRVVTPLAELVVGQRQVTEGIVFGARGGARGRGSRMADVVLEAPQQEGSAVAALHLLWFRAPPGLLARFTPGTRYRVCGVVEEFRGRKQMTHPETQLLAANESAQPRGVVPRYPSVPGVPPRRLAGFVRAALSRALSEVDEAIPLALQRQLGLGSLAAALRALHEPPHGLTDAELLLWNSARTAHHERLAFEEFFVLELALFRRRVEDQGVHAQALHPQTNPIARAREALGFDLTAAQQRVVREIAANLESEQPMRRLLQGDVGSGKTAVAMLAAAQCVAAGAQVAFMAPTEVLAEQHFRSLAPVAKALGMRAALVLGGARASHRRKTRKSLEDGTIDLAVGTHALLSEGVRFARLRLVVVDEQHRFGVGQRLRLVDKGEGAVAPHLLVMTATPIPRTLTLALHGDLETSVLDELPAGRVAPVTRAYTLDERERALGQLERGLSAGGQAYVVCPAIEDSDETELRSAEQTHSELSQRFAEYGVDLLHGRLSAEAKQAAMERFVSGQSRVLVATTIIEVGIDVPRANVMLIEHAERFGLAQLHQLRGRVGRGGQRSACLLVHEAASEESRARIQVMCETTDGFRIAEEDLRLRGPGEIFGHRQSGLPGFRFGDLRRDAPLLAGARAAAQELIAVDPELVREEHAGARAVLERWQSGSRRVVKEEAG